MLVKALNLAISNSVFDNSNSNLDSVQYISVSDGGFL